MTLPRSSWLVAAALAVTLAGCAAPGFPGSSPADPPAAVPPSAEQGAGRQGAPPSREPLRYSDPVPEPKDARAVAACDLLTDDQVRQLGLVPGSGEQRDQGPRIQTCVWSSAIHPANPVSIQKNVDTPLPVLDGQYLIRDTLLFYEEREVAGHPALRAELSDTGTCTITVAVSDYQGVAATADQPASDPCTTSTRMAEFVLSNLPPLTEE